MKLGRNDPCHCGSGKKYKKCCMDKDAAAEKASKQAEAELQKQNRTAHTHFQAPHQGDEEAIQPNPWRHQQLDSTSRSWWDAEGDDDDSDDAALDTLMEEFEIAAEEHPEQLMALFERAINEEQQFDDELALECISLINKKLGTSSSFKAIELLRQARPDLYEADKSTYLLHSIEYKLLQGETATLQPLLDDIAKRANDDIDNVMLTLDRLLYLGHSQIAIGFLSQVIQQLPREKTPVITGSLTQIFQQLSTARLPLGFFVRMSQGLVLLSKADQLPLDEAEIRVLRDRVAEFGPFEQGWLDERIDILTSSKPRSWNRADFVIPELKSGDQSILRQFASLLDLLLFVFVLDIHQHNGELSSRTCLAYLDILEYYLYQANNPPKFSSKAQKKQYFANAAAHPFALNRETFDAYLVRQLDLFFSRPLVCAATIELLPRWFQFLEAQGLLSSEEHRALLVDLGPTVETALGIFKQSSFEPHMPLAAIRKEWNLSA